MNQFIKLAQMWETNMRSQKITIEIIEKFQLLLFNGKLEDNKIVNISDTKNTKINIILINRANNNFIQKQESIDHTTDENIKIFININAVCATIKGTLISWLDMNNIFKKYKNSIMKKNNKTHDLKILFAKKIQEYFMEFTELISLLIKYIQ